MAFSSSWRIGVDLGGTKTEIAALRPDGGLALRRRVPTPASYPAIVATIAELVRAAESELGISASVGVGIPGTISPATGLVKNANSQCLIGHALDQDLAAALAREVRIENDANCFALSEAVDGAGAGHRVVFGVILGTGCGGGIVVERRIVEGRNRIAGEWGHTPLPWPTPAEQPPRPCWCGRAGCLETYLAGPALAGELRPGARDVTALLGLPEAPATLARHLDRVARGLTVVANILDPDIIVLGGGLSNLPGLAERLPAAMAAYAFTDRLETEVAVAQHGDSGGVRGAAWLWPA